MVYGVHLGKCASHHELGKYTFSSGIFVVVVVSSEIGK